jgi:hypothetical protein
LTNYRISMKYDLHEPSGTRFIRAKDDLMIPIGEFVALFICAVLTLSLLFGPPTFANAMKNGRLAFSAGAPSLKRLNVHGRNEHPTRRPKLQSADHNLAANEVTAMAAPFHAGSNSGPARKSSAMENH